MEENLLNLMKQLKGELEEYFSITIDSEAAYSMLASKVSERTAESFSARSVDRAFKYNGENTEPSLKTRNNLVLLLNYESWYAYSNRGYNIYEKDELFHPDDITVGFLKPGEYVVLGWRPTYYCVARYMGNCTFKIEKAKNMKLKLGSVFRAVRFDVASMPQPATGTSPTFGYKLLPSILAYQDDSTFYELEDCCNVEVL
ncbi:hypothetical protein [Alistipes sp. ZOR0009]|uniref:hypothetical protein n=1 Tax=Alistipes sp. ZOR0009 TaxID=1339253 RepID=UPI000647CD92|nr:hypothetical protein [Alistipes sp. ZOR0009]